MPPVTRLVVRVRLAAALLVSASALVGVSASPASAAAPAVAAPAVAAASAARAVDPGGVASGHGPHYRDSSRMRFDTVWGAAAGRELWVRSIRVTDEDGNTGCHDLARYGSILPYVDVDVLAGVQYTVESYSRLGCPGGRFMAGSRGTLTPYPETFLAPDGLERWRVHAGSGPTSVYP